MTGISQSDVRFSVPLYTQAEAARYVGMPVTTCKDWTHGRRYALSDGRLATSGPIITYVPGTMPPHPSIPFVGLAEAVFLSALRNSKVPMQQIRPMLKLVQQRLGVDYALASKRLYVAGAQLLWEVADEVDDPRAVKPLIVLKNNQYVFREVVASYLKRIEYADDGYASRVNLPGYEVARVVADPVINFGHPHFALNGTPVSAVVSRLRAGDALDEVADDFDLPRDQVAEVADREELELLLA